MSVMYLDNRCKGIGEAREGKGSNMARESLRERGKDRGIGEVGGGS